MTCQPLSQFVYFFIYVNFKHYNTIKSVFVFYTFSCRLPWAIEARNNHVNERELLLRSVVANTHTPRWMQLNSSPTWTVGERLHKQRSEQTTYSPLEYQIQHIRHTYFSLNMHRFIVFRISTVTDRSLYSLTTRAATNNPDQRHTVHSRHDRNNSNRKITRQQTYRTRSSSMNTRRLPVCEVLLWRVGTQSPPPNTVLTFAFGMSQARGWSRRAGSHSRNRL